MDDQTQQAYARRARLQRAVFGDRVEGATADRDQLRPGLEAHRGPGACLLDERDRVDGG